MGKLTSETQRSKANPLFLGFMLLSFFFGAGNLIFPPMLGMESGTQFTPAVIGFIATGIALPLLSLIVVAKSPTGLLGIGRRVHPLFAYFFAILVYLSIGVMYGIPRAANVGYEMGFQQFVDLPDKMSLVMYVVVFFSICYLSSIKSGRLIDIIGKFLTPILLVFIALLCGLAFLNLTPGSQAPTEKFASSPFSAGIIEGYFTLDALAGLAFGSVLSASIIEAMRPKSLSAEDTQAGQAVINDGVDNQQLVKTMIQSSLVAGFFLGLVYLGLAWVGLSMYQPESYENGAVLLSSAARLLMGDLGNFVLGMIVLLACLTTCIGLINACSSFAQRLFPKVSYKAYVLLFTVTGAVISNLGLEPVLAIAVPIMMFLYPISIALVLLSLIHPLIAHRPLTYVLGVGTTTLFAFNATLANLISTSLPWQGLVDTLPLAEVGLGWIVPALVMALVGFLIKRTDQAAA
ncbi:branched-chain amino acid transport system II carrier protein [Psychrobacter sp. FDAARGOS_221]|uniref:branched-chain amino acid transport system II carrier protein n=1 Tax=Psychrobacter sp. FDAARGOS_221 TaxID=1975705 RepID=UPI000BB595B5|nr:branched-chain amino acid transport system II carrier protein [Psychrobacter sp. FDAARGOS_221]PNK60973.1 branched-chain amino acid transport system II carrier protein [Psychrobacter sp. FDAARGOS_221]